MVSFWLALIVTCSAFVLGWVMGAKSMARHVVLDGYKPSKGDCPRKPPNQGSSGRRPKQEAS
jgi:hypothetical protein